MKKGIWMAVITMVVGLQSVRAQTFSEWFKQKKTQKKYLAQQIAALQVYKGYVEKGWKIAENGLNLIQGFTGGQFDLHRLFFGSLKAVSSYIKDYPRVGDIIYLQLTVPQLRNDYVQQVRKQPLLRSTEMEVVEKAYERVRVEGRQTLNDLTNVVTDGRLQMTDDERRARIDQLYWQSVEQYRFTIRFGEEALLLAAQRQQQKTDLDAMKTLSDAGLPGGD
jgi:hypothetical protein